MLLACLVPGCGGGAQIPTDPGANLSVEPYTGFFQAYYGPDVYLFADLQEKQAFDIDPGRLSYSEFITRTGQRVYVVNARPLLVPRILVGYREAVDTALVPAGVLGAPPAATPPSAAIRRTLPATQPVLPDQPTTTAATTKPATTRATTEPVDRLGPTGDPEPRENRAPEPR